MTDVSEKYFRRLVDEKALRSYLEEELGPTDEFSKMAGLDEMFLRRYLEGNAADPSTC